MKSFTVSVATVLLAASASAQYNATSVDATSTIMIKPGCPSAAPADVMVTRSPVAVPSCAAGANETKPVIVSMSTPTASGSMGVNSTKTGSPAMFTGAADSTRVGGVMVLVGGVVAGLLL